MDRLLKRGFVKTEPYGFNYLAKGSIDAGETAILRFTPVTPNKRGVNDIGWQIDGDAKLYATTSDHPERDDALWQEIRPDEDINKCASAVKVQGVSGTSKIFIRVIYN